MIFIAFHNGEVSTCMEDHATIIPAYSPLDGIADGHWTYHPNDGGRDVAWSDD